MSTKKILNLKDNTSNKLKISYHDLYFIEPKTPNQEKFFGQYNKNEILSLTGFAGTGKTFIALYKALEEILSKSSNKRRIILIRSAVPTRDVGHLPGDIDEKISVFEKPYYILCNDLFNKKDSYLRLKEQKIIEFTSTSYERGTTYDDAILIVDEFQNMTFHELDTVMTRCGINTKIIFAGDVNQSDLKKKVEMSGIMEFLNIINNIDLHFNVEFNSYEDIIRGGLVKKYIIAKSNVQ